MTILTDRVPPVSQHDRRDDPGRPAAPGGAVRADNLMAFAVVIAGMALFTALVAVGFGARAIDDAKAGGGGGTAGAAPASATVHLSEFKLEPATVTVATGGNLQLMNMGSTAHNVAIKDTDRASAMIEGGGVGTLELAGLSAGTYTI
jgi:plastocyanin